MMNHERMNNIIDELINKDKWTDILRRFSDVLKINIFIVDGYGRVFVPPYQNRERGRYGSKFLASSFGFDFSKQEAGILDDFEANGKYFEAKDPFDFHIFAIPIKTFGKSEAEEIFAYIIVGPVILTKGWNKEDYIVKAEVTGDKQDTRTEYIILEDIQTTTKAVRYMCNGTTEYYNVTIKHPFNDSVTYNISLQMPGSWTYTNSQLLTTTEQGNYTIRFNVTADQTPINTTIYAFINYSYPSSSYTKQKNSSVQINMSNSSYSFIGVFQSDRSDIK